MSAIIEECIIEATPERVFNALTQQDEIAHWWTNDLSAKPEVGSLAEFCFTQWGAGIIQFEIAELDQGKKVRWLTRQGRPQWTGTSVTWQLTPIHNETRLLFTHDGFAQSDEVYKQGVHENWQYYLNSLKSYLEMGKGTPGAPPNIR